MKSPHSIPNFHVLPMPLVHTCIEHYHPEFFPRNASKKRYLNHDMAPYFISFPMCFIICFLCVIHISGQMKYIIFHQPGFVWNWWNKEMGPFQNATFWGKSVVWGRELIWPDRWSTISRMIEWFHGTFPHVKLIVIDQLSRCRSINKNALRLLLDCDMYHSHFEKNGIEWSSFHQYQVSYNSQKNIKTKQKQKPYSYYLATRLGEHQPIEPNLSRKI